MAMEFECPGCGAPLDPSSGEAQLVCPYCGKHVIVPPELRPGRPRQAPAVQVVMARPVPRPVGPVARRRASRGGCGGTLLFLLLLSVIVPGVLGAFGWNSVQQAAQSIIPFAFASPVLTFGAKGSAPDQM